MGSSKWFWFSPQEAEKQRTCHVAFRVELAQILANATILHIRKRECQADQQTLHILAEHPSSDDLGSDCVEKQQYFEAELESILDHLVYKYQETPLSTLEGFYSPGDAQDVANYGQELIDWTSDIRKHLIQLKAETTRMLRDKTRDSEMPNGSSLSGFPSYEHRLKKIYHSVVKFEYWLKIKDKPALLSLSKPQQDLESPPSPSAAIPDTGRISCPSKPNDSAALTERLEKIRNTLTTFRTSRPEFSSNLSQIHQKIELHQSPLSFHSIYQAVNDITSERLPGLLSAAKSGYEQVLADNEKAFHIHLGQKLHASLGLIQIVLNVTNAAVHEEGEIALNVTNAAVPEEGEIAE